MESQKKKIIVNNTTSVIFGICYFLFILTFAIGVVLFFRPIFYSQIEYLRLTKATGKTYLELKNAYDALMNCMIFYEPFSLGVFTYSESGMNHFLDCQGLFLLSNLVCLFSGIILIVLAFLRYFKKIEYKKFKGFSVASYSIFVFLILVIIFAIFALIDFNSAFAFFHKIFFPGKTNWTFDPETDPIIYMFKEAFFINCALIIVSIFVILAAFPIVSDIKGIIKNKKQKKLSQKEA